MQHLESAARTLSSQLGDVAAACREAARSGGMSSRELRSVNDQLLYCAERLSQLAELERALATPAPGGGLIAEGSLAAVGKARDQHT
jgi:hypothetical protein